MFALPVKAPRTKANWQTTEPRAVKPQEKAHQPGAGLSDLAMLRSLRVASEVRPAAPIPAPQGTVAIGRTDDPMEHEADRVAGEVIRMPDSQAARAAVRGTGSAMLPAAGGKALPETVDRALNSPGHALDAATRKYFEPRMGLNLGGVRVHTGAVAGRSAGLLGARAYTYGSHIVFGAAEGPSVDRLTAHELTHVAQNSAGGEAAVIRRFPGFSMFQIVSPIWSVGGRDVVFVRITGDVRTFSFYRRTGTGDKGKFQAKGVKEGKWVPFEGFEETEMLKGDVSERSWKFHKEPYYYSDDVKAGKMQAGYGNKTNQDMAQWLDEKLPQGGPPGTRANWRTVQSELDRLRPRNMERPRTGAPQKAVTASGEIRGEPPTPVGSGAAPAAATVEGLAETASKSLTRSFMEGFTGGLKAVVSPEGIASAIPLVVLSIADRVAAKDAIRNIEMKFAKEGFAKGYAAGVVGWSAEEVAMNLKNHVTDFRIEGLSDPAGILSKDVIFKLAEGYENYAVDLGYRYSAGRSLSWKKDVLNTGLAKLAKFNWPFPDDPQVLFGYEFIDKFAYVLHSTTDPIVEHAADVGDDRREAAHRKARAEAMGAVGNKI